MSSCRWLSLVVAAGLLAGCLVPIPLNEQTVADGGQILLVTSSSNQPFGVLHPTTNVAAIHFQADVTTDSPKVFARLYLQINDSCCNLDQFEDPNVIYFSQFAIVTPQDTSMGTLSHYTVDFQQPVQACSRVAPGQRAYVIPVVSTEGFQDDPGGSTNPSALGLVDSSHYWTVQCR